jgi:hypothetical protein
MRYQDKDEIMEVIRNTYENREDVREQLRPQVLNAKRQIINVFRQILGQEKSQDRPSLEVF